MLPMASGGVAVGSRKTTVPSPYRVKLGTEVARNSIGAKPPLVETRRMTSVAPVGCWMPSMAGVAVGAGVGEGPVTLEQAATMVAMRPMSTAAGARNRGREVVMAPGTAGTC